MTKIVAEATIPLIHVLYYFFNVDSADFYAKNGIAVKANSS